MLNRLIYSSAIRLFCIFNVASKSSDLYDIIYPELQITTGNYKLLAVIQMSKEGAVTLCNYHYHLQLL